MKFVVYTDEESQFLLEVLEWWTEGLPETKQAIIEDPSVDKIEDLLTVTEGIDEQQRRVDSIRAKHRTAPDVVPSDREGMGEDERGGDGGS